MKCLAKIQLYHDILSQIFGSLADLEGKEGGMPYQFYMVEKFTLPYLCFRYLPSLVIPKVMINFAVNTTIVLQVLLDYTITAIPLQSDQQC
jgi:hypothetical protein